MTDMPQMVAIYNGMGGGAAAAIAAIEFAKGDAHSMATTVLAVIGALIGAVSFTGSCVAWAKLQGVLKKAIACRPRMQSMSCWRCSPLAWVVPWWSSPRPNRN
jgi:NAD/NADP transhydrogenase beta subunit